MYIAKVDNNNTETRLLVQNSTTKEIEYRDVSSLPSNSGISRTIINTSGNTTLGATTATDYVYFVTGAHTMSLPAAAGNTNRYTIKNNHTGNITIDTVGAENIEGVASILIAPEEAVDIISDNTNWFII